VSVVCVSVVCVSVVCVSVVCVSVVCVSVMCVCSVCVCSACLFGCDIFIGVRIIKEMPGLVASGTPCTIHNQLFRTDLQLGLCTLPVHPLCSADT
jgi:hypothetical protein